MKRSFAAFALWLAAGAAHAQATIGSIYLYQPDAVSTERLGGNPRLLADYVKALERAFAESLGKYDGPPRSITIAVVIKPGNQSRLWFAPEPSADPAALAIYRKVAPALARQAPPAVKGGTFGFAVAFSLAGGKPEAANSLPAPPEWAAVPRERKASMRVEEIWAVIWPDVKLAEPKAGDAKARAPEPKPKPAPVVPVAGKKPPAPKPAEAAPPPKPPAPCVYKPVMTDEELARCR